MNSFKPSPARLADSEVCYTRNNTKYHVRLAQRAEDILAAQRLRCTVYRDECGYLPPDTYQSNLEPCPWDIAPQCMHALVECEGKTVAVARLILGQVLPQNRSLGTFGLPIEQSFRIGSLLSTTDRVGEVGRVAVVREHQGKGAAQAAYHRLAQESLRFGVRQWIGTANSDFIHETDAAQLNLTIEHQRLWSDIRFQTHDPSVYLACAQSNRSPRRHLPSILASYVRWSNARFTAAPCFDQRFRRYIVPFLIANVQCLADRTGELFSF